MHPLENKCTYIMHQQNNAYATFLHSRPFVRLLTRTAAIFQFRNLIIGIIHKRTINTFKISEIRILPEAKHSWIIFIPQGCLYFPQLFHFREFHRGASYFTRILASLVSTEHNDYSDTLNSTKTPAERRKRHARATLNPGRPAPPS